jgi:hypothetical protein
MEPNEEDVVGKQHESAELISNAVLAKDIVAEIADVLNLRVLHDVFVHGNGCEPEENSSENHCDYSGHPSEDSEWRLDMDMYKLRDNVR